MCNVPGKDSGRFSFVLHKSSPRVTDRPVSQCPVSLTGALSVGPEPRDQSWSSQSQLLMFVGVLLPSIELC